MSYLPRNIQSQQKSTIHPSKPWSRSFSSFRRAAWDSSRSLDVHHWPKLETQRSEMQNVRSQEVSKEEHNTCRSWVVSVFRSVFRYDSKNIYDRDHEALYSRAISCTDWNWIWRNEPPRELDRPEGMRARTQFRHVMSDVGCTVMKEE
jgi:hypothetical protein